MFKRIISFTIILTVTLPTFAADWPHWGGGLGRNMVNTVEKNMPTEWNIQTGENIKWVMPLNNYDIINL